MEGGKEVFILPIFFKIALGQGWINLITGEEPIYRLEILERYMMNVIQLKVATYAFIFSVSFFVWYLVPHCEYTLQLWLAKYIKIYQSKVIPLLLAYFNILEKRGQRIEPYGTLQEFFPKLWGLFPILSRNISSAR